MRYAFVSDIHGNLAAWNTVLADMALHRVNRILCLGDTVGYGPQPAECLQSVYSHVHGMVLGNHDAVVGGRLSADVFNDRARRVIEWTGTQLGTRAHELFAHLPLVLKGEDFRCTHGEFTDPAVFNYVTTPEDAFASFQCTTEPLLFVGHTHKPTLFVTGESGAVYQVDAQDFSVEEGKRYLVNVGSVGSPRDGNPQASYVIFDDETKSVYFKRVTFDLEAFRSAVMGAQGLLPEDVQLLRSSGARAATAETVREEEDFRPSSKSRVIGGKVEAGIHNHLLRENAKLRRITLISSIACVVLVAVFLGVLLSVQDRSAEYPPFSYDPISYAENGGKDGNLLPPFESDSEKCFSCPPYRVFLSDTKYQNVLFTSSDFIRIHSDDISSETIVRPPDIECVPTDRIESICRAKFSDDFSGSFQLIATLHTKNDQVISLFTRDFVTGAGGISKDELPQVMLALPPKDGWRTAKGTSEKKFPDDVSFVRLELKGRFSGTVEIGAISAKRK